MDAVSLRPASDADWLAIRTWLARPDIQRWWGPSAASEAEVITALGTEHAIARMVQVDGVDVGYGHAVDATIWGDDLPGDLEPGTWDLDIFIAEPDYRGRGYRRASAAAAQRRSLFHDIGGGGLGLSFNRERAGGASLRKDRLSVETDLG